MKIKDQINDASDAEHRGMVGGIREALTLDASAKRGERAGRGIASEATATLVAVRLGFSGKDELRAARRVDPVGLVERLLSGE